MAFPREQLRPAEDMVLDTRPHWWFITPSALALAGAFLLAVIVLVNNPDGFVGDAGRILCGILVLGTLGWFANRYAKWVSTNFVVTSDRLIYRSGVFAKNGVEIPVDKINTVFFEQKVFERLIGLGDIRVESASATGSTVFDDIPKPSAVQAIIYGVMDQKSDSSFGLVGQATADAIRDAGIGAGGGGGSSITVAEQLEKLHQLRQSGALTDAEYEAQKAQLIGSGNPPPATP
jgi:membrane protein YdbS with pleckstrin-like domain